MKELENFKNHYSLSLCCEGEPAIYSPVANHLFLNTTTDLKTKFFKNLFYLFLAALGLSCGTLDLH